MPTEIKKISSALEFQNALKSAGDKKVIVDFYATWCRPCQNVAPVYHDLASKYSDRCVAITVDVDEAEDVAEQCGIRAMPTFQVYHTGSKVGELVGAAKRDQLENLFSM